MRIINILPVLNKTNLEGLNNLKKYNSLLLVSAMNESYCIFNSITNNRGRLSAIN
jgi:hypothetical protein